MGWYADVLKKYFRFSGRARRAEYWMFGLLNLVICVALLVVGRATGFGYPVALFVLAILPPSLALGARRLHDTGRSGWWLLIGLVPVIGAVVLLGFAAMEGEPGDNAYGGSPKYVPKHL
ncbi:DUF805 domain-containing protein [Streptomyces sp. NPDC047017]|uniref:DUF805 domain-containing protein n=1 Tax=Streptomyces sp. NPDC047017 TaxID=3155024 RepID=UPI0033D5BA17